MDPRYAAAYGVLARTHWWWRARDEVVLRTIDRLRTSGRRPRILDVGCGDGRLLNVLAAGADVVGIEPDANTGVTMHPGGYPIHLTPFEAPLPITGPFDIVLMLDVLEHLEHPVDALRLSATLLASGGAMVITVPALDALWSSHDDLNHHHRRYTIDSLGAELTAAGFEVMSARYFFHALALAKLAARGIEKLRPSSPRVPQTPPAPLNAAARGYSALEFRLTAAIGRYLPGSSILAVARRTS